MVDLVGRERELPVGDLERNSLAWWGVLCLIATEGCLFAYLLFAYAFMAVRFGKAWLPQAHPSLALALPNTLILLASSGTVWWAEKGAKAGRRGQHLAGLGLTIALGAVFLVVQVFEWRAKPYRLATSSYGSIYFTTTGFHMAHVAVGLVILSVVFAWSAAGLFTPRRHAPVLVSSAYWHFVDAVWLCVFAAFYLTPYLM